MKKFYLVAASVVTGVLLVGGVAGTAFAWHPEGKIKKEVQNVTTNSALADANDEASAVDAKPGDTLKYVVTIWNSGNANAQGLNDMWYTVMKDTLPAGVELVSDPTKQNIVENVGVVKPGDANKKVFEYLVKVTKQDDGTIKNTACFTGDSEVYDNPQKGCDDAVVKVKKPQTPPQVLSTATLPVTGAGSALGIFAGVSGLGYGLHRLTMRFKRQ